MTLLFMDGFDVADFALKYDVPGVTLSSGSGAATRYNYGLDVQAYPAGGVAVMLPKAIPASSKVIIGFALSHDSWTSSAEYELLRLYGDAGVTQHLTVTSTGDGTFKVYRGTAAGTLLGTYSGAIPGTTWSYIEVSATINDTSGNVVVRQDGVEVINFTGDTKNAGTNTTIDKFVIMASDATYRYIDDLYVLDGLGSVNNAFLGDVRIQTLLPSGAGSSTQWTPSTGSNYDNVNDVPYSSSTYNGDVVSGHRDTYAMSDVSTGSILAVQETLLALKDSAGATDCKAALKSGGSLYYGSALSITTTLAVYQNVREVDPATSAAWSTADLNAVEFGAEVI